VRKKNIKLFELQVIAFDCQASGANPDKNDLLEMAWLPFFPTDKIADYTPDSYLIKKNDRMRPLSKQVLKITGLQDTDFDNGVSEKLVWSKLVQLAVAISNKSPLETCPLIIHYARFETPYLKNLHEKFSGSHSFPFTIICTYEITRRLLNDLPRKGLRAVAGYFGNTTAEKRRSSGHVCATAVIWNNLLSLLQDRHNIESVSELLKWLATDMKIDRWRREYPMPVQQRQLIPSLPGVYRMCRSNQIDQLRT